MTTFEELLSTDGALTLLPPLVAIGFALATRRVIPSLLIAALVGAVVAADGALLAAARLLGTTVVDVVVDRDKLMITGFSIAVAAMVGVMGRAGGTRALIASVERYASGRRGAMTASWLSGAIVFFDDYANCLVVGSAMGPLCDRNRVSRAKLAYIVDATAAPVASVAVVSTWVGYEVGLFEDPLKAANVGATAFSVFLAALPYRFYCLFTLVFVGAVAWTGRDFGPMWAAERACRETPAPAEEGPNASGTHAWLAAVPVAVLVGLTFALLVRSGLQSDPDAGLDLARVLGASNPYPAMLIGSLVALGVAAAGALGARALTAEGVWQGARGAVSAVLAALAVLYLAWTLGALIEEAGTGTYLASKLGDRLSPWMLPVATYLLAGGMAFAVGSSFFTMGALLPLVLPLVLAMEGGQITPIVLATCAAVLDGAVFGDHASPISDTTILSALGSGCELVEHARTQLPYALVVAAIALLAGTIPTGLGVPLPLALLVGAAASVGAVYALGRSTEPEAATQGGG